MAQLNFTALGEPENQLHHRNAKQFGANDIPRSTTKKSALADVKNILAQRTVHSTKKVLASATKPSISKKNLFGVFNDKENDICKKKIKNNVDMSQEVEASTSSQTVLMNEVDCVTNVGFVEPVCSFSIKVEDDYADILLKSITLSKSEIDTLSMEWEGRPVVGVDDMRTFEIPAIPDEIDSINDWLEFDYDHCEPDISLLSDIPAVEIIFDSIDFEE